MSHDKFIDLTFREHFNIVEQKKLEKNNSFQRLNKYLNEIVHFCQDEVIYNLLKNDNQFNKLINYIDDLCLLANRFVENRSEIINKVANKPDVFMRIVTNSYELITSTIHFPNQAKQLISLFYENIFHYQRDGIIKLRNLFEIAKIDFQLAQQMLASCLENEYKFKKISIDSVEEIIEAKKYFPQLIKKLLFTDPTLLERFPKNIEVLIKLAKAFTEYGDAVFSLLTEYDNLFNHFLLFPGEEYLMIEILCELNKACPEQTERLVRFIISEPTKKLSLFIASKTDFEQFITLLPKFKSEILIAVNNCSVLKRRLSGSDLQIIPKEALPDCPPKPEKTSSILPNENLLSQHFDIAFSIFNKGGSEKEQKLAQQRSFRL